MKTKYNAQWFIDFYKSKPDNKWIIGDYTDGKGRYCALGWIGYAENHEKLENSLNILFNSCELNIAAVNDGNNYISGEDNKVFGNTPRERILVVLTNMKEMGL